ncbi:transposase [Rhodanobacter sp. OR87]|uniref:transposase n=1 Tax=Rhodanobacter sp. OR87 TaxID=1076523 RepID=UPI0031F2DED6
MMQVSTHPALPPANPYEKLTGSEPLTKKVWPGRRGDEGSLIGGAAMGCQADVVFATEKPDAPPTQARSCGRAAHVVQRGNDRQPCFYVEDGYRRYLAGLRESAIRYGCVVHAYVLMTNHVHVLVTPSSAGAVSRMMQWPRSAIRGLHQRAVSTNRHVVGRPLQVLSGRYRALPA